MKIQRILIPLLLSIYTFGQNQQGSSISTSTISSAFLQNNNISKQRDLSGNYYSIDASKYRVDSGDEFYIKIDISGPEIKTYNVKVSSDGYLFIPDAPGIYIRGEILSDAKKMLRQHLKKYLKNADIEVFLDKTHSIHVYLSGSLNRLKTIDLNSANRLYDVLEMIINDYQSDTLLITQLEMASLRNVDLIRGENKSQYDILKFRKSGFGDNPYLMNEDIIHIPYRDTTAGDITIQGLVGSPIKFEYKEGDNLSDALVFSGGLLPSADTSKIMLYRFIRDKNEFNFSIINYYNDALLPLKSDDRIYVRRKPIYRKKESVTVNGFVNYPGEYPIIPYKTTLSEVIKQAGGVNEFADLDNSRLLRNQPITGEKELDRINQSLMTGMTRIERNFWSNSSKENLSIIECNFNKVINENDVDIILFPDDIIEINGMINYIYMSGAVVNPGIITYHNDWNYEKYIEAAGGYKERAKKNNVKIIKSEDENWLDASKGYLIGKGDRIFVPERYERDFLSYTLQALSILGQVATIVLVATSF